MQPAMHVAMRETPPWAHGFAYANPVAIRMYAGTGIREEETRRRVILLANGRGGPASGVQHGGGKEKKASVQVWCTQKRKIR